MSLSNLDRIVLIEQMDLKTAQPHSVTSKDYVNLMLDVDIKPLSQHKIVCAIQFALMMPGSQNSYVDSYTLSNALETAEKHFNIIRSALHDSHMVVQSEPDMHVCQKQHGQGLNFLHCLYLITKFDKRFKSKSVVEQAQKMIDVKWQE
jgi:hypothetical protein